jgi:hypothetical protein
LHETRSAHQSLGWSHLVRHGMGAWMQAVTREPSQTAALPYMRNRKATLSWPSDAMVTVLAGMALGCFREVA